MRRSPVAALSVLALGAACEREQAASPVTTPAPHEAAAVDASAAEAPDRAPRFEPPRFEAPELEAPSATPELDARARAIRAETLPAPFAALQRVTKAKGPSAWLLTQPETGQSYAQFLAAQTALPGRAIYLATAGALDPDQAALARDIERLTRAWFQLDVKRAPVIPAAVASLKSREHQGGTQWLTHTIMDALAKQKPKDALASMALTQTDLYPAPDWNYLFGQARYGSRVGVTSFARMGNIQAERSVALRRAFAISSHEIGHMFGIKHCIAWECAMNGMMNRIELDMRPLEPCPSCLAKLQRAIGFDPQRRWLELSKLYVQLGLAEDALAVSMFAHAAEQ
jgi:archaemetzincin